MNMFEGSLQKKIVFMWIIWVYENIVFLLFNSIRQAAGQLWFDQERPDKITKQSDVYRHILIPMFRKLSLNWAELTSNHCEEQRQNYRKIRRSWLKTWVLRVCLCSSVVLMTRSSALTATWLCETACWLQKCQLRSETTASLTADTRSDRHTIILLFY